LVIVSVVEGQYPEVRVALVAVLGMVIAWYRDESPLGSLPELAPN
jgi:hypothetical protein